MKYIYTLLCLLLLSGVVSADISGMALISDGDTITKGADRYLVKLSK